MSGMAGNAATMPALVAERASSDPAGVILRRKDRGIWKPVTWGDLAQRMNAAAAALHAAGIGSGDVVAILSDTNPAWATLDLGIQAAGAIAAGINPADPPAEVARLLRETGARLLFVEGEAMLDKALEARGDCPALTRIVIMDMKGLRDLADPGCESLDAFLARAGSAAPPGVTLDPDAPAVLIPTSGTAGPARAVALSHRNIQAAIAAAAGPLDVRSADERLAFLPMCHVIERVLGLYLSLCVGAISNYVEGVDTVPENLQELQPTVLIAPPRFWRRLHARIDAASAAATPVQRWLLRRTLAAGLARSRGTASAIDRSFLGIGRRPILAPVRRSLGLGRLRRAVFAFGGVAEAVSDWLHAVGIETAELYGQTEAGGFGFLVSQAASDDVRLAGDGEIQVRGTRVALGYRQGDALAPLATADGWLCTGDAGEGRGGRLAPAGRLSEGRDIAAVEAALRSSPYISDAVAVPAGGGFAALVMIDPDTVEPWAQRHKVPFTGFASLVRAEEVKALVAETVRSASRSGAGAIRAFRLIEQRYEPGDNELSPVFAPRRALLRERHGDLIAAMLPEA